MQDCYAHDRIGLLPRASTSWIPAVKRGPAAERYVLSKARVSEWCMRGLSLGTVLRSVDQG